MAKNTNKLKQKRVINEDMTNVRNMAILLVIVVLVCIGLYFLTEHLVKGDKNTESTKTETKIDYDIATIGTMFNRIEEEYYVLIYSSEKFGSKLDSTLTTYRSSDNYIKTYYIDLDKKINQIASGDETVTKPSNSNEVKVSEVALYKINNGVVTNCYTDVDAIKDLLK